MADVKITGLTPKAADMAVTDLAEITVDPSGSPLTRSVTGTEMTAMVVTATSGVTLQAFNTNLTAINQALTTTSNVDFGTGTFGDDVLVTDSATVGINVNSSSGNPLIEWTTGSSGPDLIGRFNPSVAGVWSFGVDVSLDRFVISAGTVLTTDPQLSLSTLNNVAIFSGRASIDDTTDSTSVSTGSGVFDGGLGVAKAVFIGGNLTVETSNEVFLNLPTSAGTTGSLWNDSGTVKVA